MLKSMSQKSKKCENFTYIVGFLYNCFRSFPGIPRAISKNDVKLILRSLVLPSRRWVKKSNPYVI